MEIAENTNITPIVYKFYDKTGKLDCNDLRFDMFSPAEDHFNPGLYSGVLWLDVYFPDTTRKLGSEYVIDFGPEGYQCIEVFTKKEDKWIFFGRTGRSLKRAQMSSPTWKQNIPLNEAELENAVIHNIRIKMITLNASPVNIKLLPRRIYDYQTTRISLIYYLLAGFFLVIVLLIFLYGFILKDKVYLFLGASSLFISLTIFELKGPGPLFLWNFITLNPHSSFLSTIFSHIGFALLLTDFVFIAYENRRKIYALQLVIISGSLLAISLLYSLFFPPSNITFLISTVTILLYVFLFYLLIIKNKINRRKDISIMILFWLIALAIIFIRESIHYLRTFLPYKIFQVLDNDYFASLDLIFILITVPSLYIMGRRLTRRFVLNRKRVLTLSNNVKEIRGERNLFFLITNELLEIQNSTYNLVKHLFSSGNVNNVDYQNFLIRTIERSRDILNVTTAFNTHDYINETPILLVPFLNSCIKTSENSAKNRDNTLSVTISIPSDCIVYANKDFLEIIFADFVYKVIQYSPSNRKITINFAQNQNIITCVAEVKSEYYLTDDFASLLQLDKNIKYEEENINSTEIGFKFINQVAKFYDGGVTMVPSKSGYSFICSITLNRMTFNEQNVTTETECSRLNLYKQKISQKNTIYTLEEPFCTVTGKPPTILLIEDGIENGDFITLALENKSIIHRAINGMEAWNYLSLHENGNVLPDLIICEYNLPLMSGTELLRKCRQEEYLQNIPFIFLLPVSIGAKKTELIDKGVSSCIIMPFTEEELINTVRSLFVIKYQVHKAFISNISNLIKTNNNDQVVESTTQTKKTSNQEKRRSIILTSTQKSLFFQSLLSSREQQIAILISEGKSDKQIADELNISPATVATHNKKLFKKLNVHSRVELMNKIR